MMSKNISFEGKSCTLARVKTQKYLQAAMNSSILFNGKLHKVKGIMLHPEYHGYDDAIAYNDIAIVEFEHAIKGVVKLELSKEPGAPFNTFLTNGGFGMRSDLPSKIWRRFLGGKHNFERCLTTDEGPAKSLPCSK